MLRQLISTGLISAALLGSACGDGDPPRMDGGGTPPQATLPADVCLVPGCACDSGENEGGVGPVPEAGELGHWAAGHIPLPSTPYLVTTVVFGLLHPDFDVDTAVCSPNLGGMVQLFTSDGPTPPSDPAVLWESTVPSDDGGSSISLMALTVDPPLRIEEGQELFVSLEMAGTAEAYTCAYVCGGADATASDASWWSGAATPPYAWQTLSSFGFDTAYQLGVDGMAVE